VRVLRRPCPFLSLSVVLGRVVLDVVSSNVMFKRYYGSLSLTKIEVHKSCMLSVGTDFSAWVLILCDVSHVAKFSSTYLEVADCQLIYSANPEY
jgi:hypothetical protein